MDIKFVTLFFFCNNAFHLKFVLGLMEHSIYTQVIYVIQMHFLNQGCEYISYSHLVLPVVEYNICISNWLRKTYTQFL